MSCHFDVSNHIEPPFCSHHQPSPSPISTTITDCHRQVPEIEALPGLEQKPLDSNRWEVWDISFNSRKGNSLFKIHEIHAGVLWIWQHMNFHNFGMMYISDDLSLHGCMEIPTISAWKSLCSLKGQFEFASNKWRVINKANKMFIRGFN